MTKAHNKHKLALHWKIMIGLSLGIVWAYLSVKFGWGDFTKNWISPFGDIFIRALKFIAVPLVLFSIVTGVASLKDISKLGRVGAKTLSVYLFTTFLAITVGLIVVNLIKPGKTISEDVRLKNRINYELWVEADPAVDYKDDLRLLSKPEHQTLVQSILGDSVKVDSKVEEAKANFFGICLLLIPADKSKPVLHFFDGVNEVFLKMVDLIMKAAPYFVFALMAGMLSKVASTISALQEILFSLGAYSLVVIFGLILMLLFYPLFVTTFVKRIKFMEFWRKISPAQLMAFSTSSSAATLPVTMECVEKNIGVKPEIASFVLPIGATVNMDGTSLYQAVAVIYLAQIHMIDLTMTDQLVIVMTAALASIGSAAVPGAGRFILMYVITYKDVMKKNRFYELSC